MSLYADKHPTKSTKNTGFKNKEKAEETINIIKKLEKNKQMQIVLTMYYRAKHHPHRTKDMESAMKIYKTWLTKKGYKNSIS